jgi:glycopeptide antibiotics resistance protein|tara:strand:+ start:470 stop:658 length:189 start_codon:yes stop_codon:yes gene_type:complete
MGQKYLRPGQLCLLGVMMTVYAVIGADVTVLPIFLLKQNAWMTLAVLMFQIHVTPFYQTADV